MRSRAVCTSLFASCIAIALIGIPHVSGQESEPIPEDELPRFLGDVPPDQITWRVMHSIDFAVYTGTANPPLNGSVNFYVGGFPQDVEPGETAVQSRLGRYRAKWQRTVAVDGSIRQETIIALGGALNAKAHVWAEAPNPHELEKLLSVVARLPIFSSGRLPDRFHEFETGMFQEQRIAQVTWVSWWTVTLTSAWFAGRFGRRRGVSAMARPLIFAGVVGFWIAASVGVAMLSPPAIIDWFIITGAFRLLVAAAVLVVSALLVAGGMFLLRFFRAKTAPRAPRGSEA